MPRSASVAAQSSRISTSCGSSASSRNSVAREMRGELTSKNGFSVVAPMRMSVPSSTPGRRASCCDLLKRWISSRNSTVRRSSSSSRRLAVASTSRTSLTPADVAESCSNAAAVSLATSRARVVFPVPGGPHRIIDSGLPARTIVPKAAPFSSRCPCPTTSSRERGRIRAARGSAARRRTARSPAKRSSIILRVGPPPRPR